MPAEGVQALTDGGRSPEDHQQRQQQRQQQQEDALVSRMDDGWSSSEDDNGQRYWYNLKTGEARWDPPPVPLMDGPAQPEQPEQAIVPSGRWQRTEDESGQVCG